MRAAVVGAEPHHGPVGPVEQLHASLGDRGETGGGVPAADPSAVGAERLHRPLPASDTVERRPTALRDPRSLDQRAHQEVQVLTQLLCRHEIGPIHLEIGRVMELS